MENAQNFDPSKLRRSIIFLIENGQKKFGSPRKFKRKPLSLLTIGFLVLGSALICVFLISFWKTKSISVEEDFIEIITGLLPTFITAVVAFLITYFLTVKLQQRKISFEMIDELNSERFSKIRHELTVEMDRCMGKKDLNTLVGWFPNVFLYDEKEPFAYKSFEDFDRSHAMSNMVYFILRIAHYHRHHMIDLRLTRHLFHSFFSHYELVMLEFADCIEKVRLECVKQGFNFDERWDWKPENIRYFFRNVLGLSGELPPGHHYAYFPSYNQKDER